MNTMNKEVKFKDLTGNYDPNFNPSHEYLDSMPDLQNSDFKGIPIEFVGIQDFKIPIKIREKNGGFQNVLASISGSCSIDAHTRGLNMSRIIRTFYKSKDDVFDINKLEEVLRNYQKDQKSFDAHILMNFEYYQWQDALVSRKDNGEKEGGYATYNITFDCNLDMNGEFKKIMWVDFTYSSACPCSTALTEHAAYTQGLHGIPHSQRSLARLGIEFDNLVWIEDVLDHCRKALITECQIFVKRVDEMQFACMNYSSQKFVEDAVRLIADELNKDKDILDYKVICVHNESLHPHSVFGVITKGLENSIFNHHVSINELRSMVV